MNCYDATAFALPAQFTFGNADRNILRGPKFMSTDLSFMKTVPIGGGARFQFRAEMYNIFNNVNYANPGSTFGVPWQRPSAGSPPPARCGRCSSAGRSCSDWIGDAVKGGLVAPPFVGKTV